MNAIYINNGCGLKNKIGALGFVFLLASQQLQGATPGLISTMRSFIALKLSRPASTSSLDFTPSPRSASPVLSPTSPYSPMKLHDKGHSSYEFRPREEPFSPDMDDEYISRADRDKERKKDKDEKAKADPQNVVAVALSSQGTFAAVVMQSGGRKVLARNATGILKERQIVGSAPTLAVSFWNEHIMLLNANGSTRYWDVPHNHLSCFDLPHCTPFAMDVHTSGKYAIISVLSHTHGPRFYFFQAAQAPDGSVIKRWKVKGHVGDLRERVTSIALHPTDNSFAVATADGKIQLWNISAILAEDRQKVAEWSRPRAYMKTDDRFRKIDLMIQREAYIVSVSSRGIINWWDTRTGESMYDYTNHKNYPLSSFKHLDDTVYVSGSADGMLKLWDTRRPIYPVTIMGHGAPVAAITLLDKGDRFASCSKNGVVKCWDFQGKQVK